jgi:Cu/Ag efflux protein CusF
MTHGILQSEKGGVNTMKKVAVVLAVVVLVLSLVSLVLAAEAKMGTIKGVDAKAGTVTFCPEGTNTDMTLKADKSIDLSKVKAGEKVEVSVEKDTMKSMKAVAPSAKPKAAVGC